MCEKFASFGSDSYRGINEALLTCSSLKAFQFSVSVAMLVGYNLGGTYFVLYWFYNNPAK